MRHKERFLPLALILFSLPVLGQSDNDFGLDLSVGAEKKLMENRLSIGLTGNFRSQDKTRRTERIDLELSAAYKLISRKRYNLKVELSYEHIWSQKLGAWENAYKLKPRHVVYEDDKFDYAGDGVFTPVIEGYTSGYNIGLNYTDRYWRERSRVNLGASFTYKPNKRWSFSLKETLQFNHYYSADTRKTEYRDKIRYKERYDEAGNWFTYCDTTSTVAIYTKNKQAKNKWVLRSKLTAEYDIRRSAFSPFASVDYGQGLNYNAQKWKFTAGTGIKLSQRHRLKVFYRFQTENDDDEPNGHLIGAGYNFEF